MMPLKDIKPKSAKRKVKNNFGIVPADPDKTYFKRDVGSLMEKLNKQLDKEVPVTEHFYSVLSKSKIGQISSLGQHLSYKFKLNQLGDHQYISKLEFETNLLSIEEGKLQKISNVINEGCKNSSSSTSIATCTDVNDTPKHENLFVYPSDCPTYKKLENDIKQHEKSENILLDLCYLNSPCPSGTNYVDVEQNTEKWKDTRKFKITGSRLPSLL